MINILADLKEKYNMKSIKAEFEDEGLSCDEILKLKFFADKLNVNFAAKIGGCGALTDIKYLKDMGAKTIIAPMIESPYALQKFIKSIKNVYKDEKINLYINIETKNGLNSLDETLSCDEIKNLNGLILGRSDMARSLGLKNSDVNGENILEIARYISKKAKENDLEFIIGGGITPDSLKFLYDLGLDNFDYFETRKIIFNSSAMKNININDGIILALKFEIMWLKSLKNPLKTELERIEKLEEIVKKIPAVF